MILPPGYRPFFSYESYDSNDDTESDAQHPAEAPTAQLWETDAGQAVLDGIAADANWEVSIAVAVYDDADVDDTPPVAAPSPADLDSRGALGVLGEPEQLEYHRSTMERWTPLRYAWGTTDFAERAGFAECELDHAALEQQSEDAKQALKEVMRYAQAHRLGYDTELVVWREGSYAFPNNMIIPVSCAVSMTIDNHGNIVNHPGRDGAVSVIMLHGGNNKGPVVSLDADGIPPPFTMDANDLAVPGLDAVMREVTYNSLFPDAWAAGVEAWVDEYASLPAATGALPEIMRFGDAHLPESLRAVLTGGHEERGEAAVSLAALFFNPLEEFDVRTFLATPLPHIFERLEPFGVTDRYAWLLQRFETIRASVIEHEQSALDAGMRPAYTAWHREKEVIIQRVAAVAEDLQGLAATREPHILGLF